LLPHTIQHDGLTRSFLLYVPRHARGGARLPLVLVFHGGGGSPQAIADKSAMHQVADREGFIVAYPAGLPSRSGLTWSPGERGAARNVDDIGFVRALIAELRRRHRIDPDRIYAAGLSLGGTLVYELAGALSAELAAVGVVAGVMTSFDCDPVRPVPLIHIHGTDDRRVPLEGGRGRFTSAQNDWPPVQDSIDRWCELNGCRGQPQVVRLIEGLTGYRYTGAADVELWLVEGGHHVWPGGIRERQQEAGVPTAVNFSASEKLWKFFAAHPRGA
jgi:polyhydroxybutyrate depolymerase